MKIERISISSFGRLTDFDLTLSDGINILEGANESGKSTIAAFIRFIFYGLSGKADGELSPREKYLTWGKKEAMGSLTVSNAKGTYRIERAIVQNTRGVSEHLTVIDTATGSILKNADPVSMFLEGTPEDVFCRTAFVGQADGSTVDGKKISEAIENILSSADESVNTKKAIKKLDDARVMLLHKNKKGGKIYELENKKDDLIARAHRAEEDCRLMEEKKKFLADTNANLLKNKEQLQIAEAELAYTEARRRLEQIEKSKRAEEELQNSTEELDETVASLLCNDYCPDTSYLHALENVEKQLSQIISEKKKIKEKINTLKSEASEEIAPAANTETISLLREHRLQKDRFRLFALIAFATGILTDVLGIVIHSTFVAIVLPVICLAGCAALLYLCAKETKAYRSLLHDLGAESEDSLDELVTLAATQNAKQQLALKNIAALEEEYRAVQAAEGAMMRDAIALGAKWGKTITTTADLAVLIQTAKEACDRLDKAAKNKENCELTYKAVRTVCSEEELLELRDTLQKGGKVLSPEEYTKVKRSQTFYRQTIDMLTMRARETEHLLIELRARTEIPQNLRDAAAKLSERIEDLHFRHDAYLLACQKLSEATALLRARITPMLSGEASDFMCHATEGKYDTVGVSDTFALSYSDGNNTRSTEFLSCGTKDLAYLGLRLGLVKTLFPESTPTLVFDESFSRLDDRRLALVFTYLARFAENGGQILLMTSSKRERKFAEAMGNCYVQQL